MQVISRDQLKELFSDVKHFRIAEDFEEVDFSQLYYYSFFDQSDFIFYTVYEFENELVGIRWNCSRPSAKPLALGICDICKKHRKREEVVSVYTKTKFLPPGVNYRSRGFQICFDYKICNEELEDVERLNFVYLAILRN